MTDEDNKLPLGKGRKHREASAAGAAEDRQPDSIKVLVEHNPVDGEPTPETKGDAVVEALRNALKDQEPLEPDPAGAVKRLATADDMPNGSGDHVGESSGKRSGRRRDRGPKQSTDLVECLTEGVELWLSTMGDAYASIPVENGTGKAHLENVKLKSDRFKEFAVDRWYQATGNAPGNHSLDEAIAVLAAKARRGGLVYETYIRVAEHCGEVWIDLGDPDWKSVNVTPDGYRVVGEEPAPVKFLRNGPMRALPDPEPGGSIFDLRDFVNVADDDDLLMLVAWVIGAFRPRKPYAILAIDGPQGSAKSTVCSILRALVDPNGSPLRAAPTKEVDLAVMAENNWVPAFDNQSELRADLSDWLCRLATGAGLSMRELYKTREEAVFYAARPILINGIPGVGSRGDLVERCIQVTLPAIDKSKRKTERKLWEEFHRQWPFIFGAILDGVSAALCHEQEIFARLEDDPEAELPRMADFAVWTMAALDGVKWEPEEGQRWDSERFSKVYNTKGKSARRAASEDDPVADAIRKLVEGYVYTDHETGAEIIVRPAKLPYQAMPTELHAELERIVRRQRGGDAIVHSRAWPAFNKLSGRLKRAAGPFQDDGIIIKTDTRGLDARGNPRRMIRIDRQVAETEKQDSDQG